MKKGLLVICVILLALLFASVAYADDDTVDITPLLDELLSKTDLSEWDKFVEANDIFSAYSNELSPKEFISTMETVVSTVGSTTIPSQVRSMFLK